MINYEDIDHFAGKVPNGMDAESYMAGVEAMLDVIDKADPVRVESAEHLEWLDQHGYRLASVSEAYDDDRAAVLICAERYALGRMTYMPGIVIGYIVSHPEWLNKRDLCAMQRDISEYFRNQPVPPPGDCGEYALWESMLGWIEKQKKE